MIGQFRSVYTRRRVPPTPDTLSAWLATELYNIQRAILPPNQRTLTASATLLQTDNLVLGDASAGVITLTLPDATKSQGQQVTVKKSDSSGNAVTVASVAGTIDGATTVSLAAQYNSRTVISDGVAWWIIAST